VFLEVALRGLEIRRYFMAKCPFCNKEVIPENIVKEGGHVQLFANKLKLLGGNCVLIYSCPHCKKVLSVGGLYG